MEMKACEQFILSVHYEKNIRDKGIFVSVNRIISSVMLLCLCKNTTAASNISKLWNYLKGVILSTILTWQVMLLKNNSNNLLIFRSPKSLKWSDFKNSSL